MKYDGKQGSFNPLGYKTLLTYQQGKEIETLTKDFCNKYLDSTKDRRLIEQMVSCGRSLTANIAEGWSRNQTKSYIDFLKYSLASLIELLEDCFELEREYKGGQRKTKSGEVEELSKLIKLIMGEKTMLTNQIRGLEEKYLKFGDQKDQLKYDRNEQIKRQIYNGLWD